MISKLLNLGFKALADRADPSISNDSHVLQMTRTHDTINRLKIRGLACVSLFEK
jgi:hypothetical protein